MKLQNSIAPVVTAVVLGALLFFATATMFNHKDPLDSSLYWSAVYPVAIFLCAVLAYVWPDRSWRWPFWLFEAQFLAMCIHSGELGNLWPLSMVLFAVIALPGVLAARLASRLRGVV